MQAVANLFRSFVRIGSSTLSGHLGVSQKLLFFVKESTGTATEKPKKIEDCF